MVNADIGSLVVSKGGSMTFFSDDILLQRRGGVSSHWVESRFRRRSVGSFVEGGICTSVTSNVRSGAVELCVLFL